MPNFVALFNFKKLNADQYPEDQRYGEGSIQIVTDKEPSTQEDFTEIAKAIFRNGGYEQVAVTKVFYDDDNLFHALNKPAPLDSSYVIDAESSAGIEDMLTDGEVIDEQ